MSLCTKDSLCSPGPIPGCNACRSQCSCHDGAGMILCHHIRNLSICLQDGVDLASAYRVIAESIWLHQKWIHTQGGLLIIVIWRGQWSVLVLLWIKKSPFQICNSHASSYLPSNVIPPSSSWTYKYSANTCDWANAKGCLLGMDTK